ncbi:MAG: hypothetical protein Q8Q59_11115 [Luteolibacter sp.]|nr:hypothetical protein [Luteolibacter sp.]
MAEQLYRRGADGIMETVTPIANGKAAALSAYLAQGGTPFRASGRFKKGKLKGKNVDEATAEFERMWASSPDALKEKYASRAQKTDLAPSERRIAGVDPAPPSGTAQSRRMASYGFEMRDGQAVRIGTPARQPAKDTMQPGTSKIVPGPPAPAASFAPGSDEARAAAFTEMSRDERFATADTGDGGMAAAIAMENYAGKPVSPPVEQTPIERIVGGTLDASSRFLDRATTAVGSTIAAPFTPPSEQIVGRESEAARRTYEAKRVADEEAAQQRLIQENAARLRAEKGLQAPPSTMPVRSAQTGSRAQNIVDAGGDVSKLNTADRMFAEGKTNAGGVPIVKAPLEPTTPSSAPTPVTGTKPSPRINSLTGLPMGYRPGDVVAAPQQVASDRSVRTMRQSQELELQQPGSTVATPAMQAGAQRMMQQDGVVPRPTIGKPAPPIQRPAIETNAFSNAAYAKTQAAQAQGVERAKVLSRATNQDDPRKFFTGRTLPLDQLVQRPNLQGIGTPAIMPGVRPTPRQVNPANSSRPDGKPDAPQVIPMQPRKHLIPGVTRPQFAMARR